MVRNLLATSLSLSLLLITSGCAEDATAPIDPGIDEEIDGAADTAGTHDNGPLAAALATTACTDARIARQAWTFDVAREGVVTVSTAKAPGKRTFDTALDLYVRRTSRWSRVATNDDDPGNAPYSRVETSLAPGSYRVIARAARSGARGCFSVSLTLPAGPGPNPSVLGPNDVSVLFPLPTGANDAAYLTPATAGRGGPLLPRAFFDQLPALHAQAATGAAGYGALRVLAARFDPCFSASTGGACDRQVRLVMQPIGADGAPLDGAVHAFYRVTTEEMRAIVAELVRLHGLAPQNDDDTLSVSPALAAQGVSGAYGTALRALITRYAGQQSLVRITFMRRTGSRQTQWQFGVFDVRGTSLVAGTIHGTGATLQTLNQQLGSEPRFTIDPLDTADDISLLLDASSARAATSARREAALRTLLTLENPMSRQPDEVQCATCHAANVAGRWAERTFELGSRPFTERFASERSLARRSEGDGSAEIVRVFGWFGRMPVVAQRVANETALVLDVLAADFPN